MPEPSRRRFQLHLSTAIALLFAAAGIITLNSIRQETIFDHGTWRGWPYQFLQRGMIGQGYGITDILYWRLLVNLAVAGAILLTVWFLSEWARSRQRFQIHLSTAIVLMFVAGGCVWANVSMRETPYLENTDYFMVEYGWPWPFWGRMDNYFFSPLNPTNGHISYLNLLGDITVATGTILGVWFVCEWWIRRCAVRKAVGPHAVK